MNKFNLSPSQINTLKHLPFTCSDTQPHEPTKTSHEPRHPPSCSDLKSNFSTVLWSTIYDIYDCFHSSCCPAVLAHRSQCDHGPRLAGVFATSNFTTGEQCNSCMAQSELLSNGLAPERVKLLNLWDWQLAWYWLVIRLLLTSQWVCRDQ